MIETEQLFLYLLLYYRDYVLGVRLFLFAVQAGVNFCTKAAFATCMTNWEG